MAEPIKVSWKPKKTRQVEGRDSEKRQAKRHGARLHPNSGAGHIKDDASNDDTVYEFKDAKKQHTLKVSDLEALFRRSVRQGKDAAYVILFSDNNLEATITLRRTR